MLLIIECRANRDIPFLHHVPYIRRDQPSDIYFDFVCATARRVMMAVARLYLVPDAIFRFWQGRQLHMVPLTIDEAQFSISAKPDMLNRRGLAVAPGAAQRLFLRQPVRAAEQSGNRIDIKRLPPDGPPIFGDAPWVYRDEISDVIPHMLLNGGIDTQMARDFGIDLVPRPAHLFFKIATERCEILVQFLALAF